MDEKKYLDFDILIDEFGEDYRTRVLNSPYGRATHDFALPFTEVELENFILRVGLTRRGTRRHGSPEMQAAKKLGTQLYQSVFSGDVLNCLNGSLVIARQQNNGLRIRFRLSNAPKLINIPWEYLFESNTNRFLSLSMETPIVRDLDLQDSFEPVSLVHPLRILVMIANPSDFHQLDVDGEWQNLKNAVKELEERGLIVIERLTEPSLIELQRQLRRQTYNIFHFIGHGGFDQNTLDGVLVLENKQKKGHLISGQYLGTLLHDEKTIRLAVFNMCEGGRTSSTDPFAGVAQSLLQQGIPAVIAMQFEITDHAAITFAQEFYTAISDGYPVDASITEARKAIFAQENDVEWGTPVLYMHSADGVIFSINPRQTTTSPQTTFTESKQSNQAKAIEPSPMQQAVVNAQKTVSDLSSRATNAITPFSYSDLPIGHRLAFLGAIVSLVAFFMPWISVSDSDNSIFISGWGIATEAQTIYITVADKRYEYFVKEPVLFAILGASLVVVLISILAVRRKVLVQFDSDVLVVLGILPLIILNKVFLEADSLPGSDIRVAAHYGLISLILGCIATEIGGVLNFISHREIASRWGAKELVSRDKKDRNGTGSTSTYIHEAISVGIHPCNTKTEKWLMAITYIQIAAILGELAAALFPLDRYRSESGLIISVCLILGLVVSFMSWKSRIYLGILFGTSQFIVLLRYLSLDLSYRGQNLSSYVFPILIYAIVIIPMGIITLRQARLLGKKRE